MANVFVEENTLTDIADAIRNKTGSEDLILPSDMPTAINGIGVGEYNEGYAAGVKSEYDRFWDAFQDNGARTSYSRAFKGWRQDCFKPKYDLVPTGNASSMFAESQLTDVASALKECGILLDTSQATNVQMLFYWMKQLTAAPTIDTRNAPSLYYMFGSSNNLQSIEKIILKDDGSQVFDGAFNSCSALRELRFEGVIGNALNITSSTLLSYDSLMSIINALQVLPTETTKTITLGSTNIAKLTEEDIAIITQKGWTLLA